jgi:hypothetical protein
MTTEEFSLDAEHKYARYGYVPSGKKVDALLSVLLEQIPGDGRLPARWKHYDQQSFQDKYGHLGTVLWAPASSSHLLLVGGCKVLRFWTTTTTHAYVDISDVLASQLSQKPFAEISNIPAGNVRKCKPFTQRIRVHQKFHVLELAKVVRYIYGLDHARVSVRMWT